MDLYEALLTKALYAVLHPDHEAFLRHAKRFYSKTFHVPLPQVDDLNEEEVLQAYYEEALDLMSEDAREELFDTLTETEEEREKRAKQGEAMEEKDDEFFKNLNQEVVSGALRGPPKATPRPKKWTPKAKPIRVRLEKTGLPPEPPPAPPPSLPDIHMDFGDVGGNLPGIPGEWADMDPLAPPPKK